jgi:hypothetical protein
MIFINNASIERFLKQLIFVEEFEQQKYITLVLEVEKLPRAPRRTSNPDDYDLVGRFTSYIDEKKGKPLRKCAIKIKAATETLHARINEVERLASSLRMALTDEHALTLNILGKRKSRLRPLRSRVKKGFEILSSEPPRRPRLKRPR